jgi:hypothetical protein
MAISIVLQLCSRSANCDVRGRILVGRRRGTLPCLRAPHPGMDAGCILGCSELSGSDLERCGEEGGRWWSSRPRPTSTTGLAPMRSASIGHDPHFWPRTARRREARRSPRTVAFKRHSTTKNCSPSIQGSDRSMGISPHTGFVGQETCEPKGQRNER